MEDERLRVVVFEPAPLLAEVLVHALSATADVVVYAGAVTDLMTADVLTGAKVLVAGPGVDLSALPDVVPRLLSRGIRTLVVSSAGWDDRSGAVLLAGASGFVPTVDTSPGELAAAVRRVAAGTSALHPDMVHAILSQWRKDRVEAPSTVEAGSLTAREVDVLRGLGDGLTTRLIAARLGVAEKTVETHKSRLFAKLGARNQSQAVHAGNRLGLL